MLMPKLMMANEGPIPTLRTMNVFLRLIYPEVQRFQLSLVHLEHVAINTSRLAFSKPPPNATIVRVKAWTIDESCATQ